MGTVGRHWRNGRIARPSLCVALCTHNPRRDFLDRTLASLRAQSVPAGSWEFLLIDNVSTNGVPSTTDLSWHPRARLVREEKIGLTMARLRAIAETSAELILFVDDDNVLAPDYVATLLQLADCHPRLGCFGAGRLEPEFEEQPKEELRTFTYMLALRSVPKAQWSNIPADNIIPWGAGLAVRREVATAFANATVTDTQRQLLGRTGQALHSGEDDEFSWIACDLGFGKGIFPELVITHLISAVRVQLDYLMRIAEGHAYSSAILDALHGIPVTETPVPTVGLAVSYLARLRPLSAYRAGRRAWSHHRRPELQLRFEAAERAGRRRALETIASRLTPR